MKNITKIIDPRISLFFFALPFMIICPLSIFSLFTGNPHSIILNNSKIESYESILNRFELPEKTEQIGKSWAMVGNFDDKFDGKCDIVGAFVIASMLDQDTLSKEMLATYQALYNSGKLTTSELQSLDGAVIKIFPVLSENSIFDNDEVKIDIVKNIKAQVPLPLKDGESAYMAYVIKFDAFTSRDYRCK